MKPPRIKSETALIDVTVGRAAMTRIVDRGMRTPVTITGYIDYQWGGDDGTSREFVVRVETVKTGVPYAK